MGEVSVRLEVRALEGSGGGGGGGRFEEEVRISVGEVRDSDGRRRISVGEVIDSDWRRSVPGSEAGGDQSRREECESHLGCVAQRSPLRAYLVERPHGTSISRATHQIPR